MTDQDDIMQWVGESGAWRFHIVAPWTSWCWKISYCQKDCRDNGWDGSIAILVATFFFSRTSPMRNTKDRLVVTLAYQMALSIPDTRCHIENSIDQDPAIFEKNIQMQLDTSLSNPYPSQCQLGSFQIFPLKNSIIIDGLDQWWVRWSKQPHTKIILRLRFDPLHDVR